MSSWGVFYDDLARCDAVMRSDSWELLRGKSLFMTGVTGFVGKWLLTTLCAANERYQLGCRITGLSRNVSRFEQEMPKLASNVNWVQGDIRDFAMPSRSHDIIVHAATDVASANSPRDTYETCADGTRRLMAFAERSGATRLLLISSGAIYGRQLPNLPHVPETYMGGPDPLLSTSAYAEGKRAAEWLATSLASASLQVKVARLFSVVGPYLPLDKHFAIGNFLRAALAGEDMLIQGDGTPLRSYLYTADMCAWLWMILLRGKPKTAYNVGSELALSIADIAAGVKRVSNASSRILILKTPEKPVLPERYVPSTLRARDELNLASELPFDEAVKRTLDWHRQRNQEIG